MSNDEQKITGIIDTEDVKWKEKGIEKKIVPIIEKVMKMGIELNKIDAKFRIKAGGMIFTNYGRKYRNSTENEDT